ncbi:hypothetical protein WMY93_001810 [Mugilogobius chulae]|uniref:Uncharacterized protein n=1 Tax=Mugilogobius chulae TaxID=88201 RepID=A0AAW0PUJ0_9GOBI
MAMRSRCVGQLTSGTSCPTAMLEVSPVEHTPSVRQHSPSRKNIWSVENELALVTEQRARGGTTTPPKKNPAAVLSESVNMIEAADGPPQTPQTWDMSLRFSQIYAQGCLPRRTAFDAVFL